MPAFNLTGAWAADDGATYYLRQLNDGSVTWAGLHNSGFHRGIEFTNVFHGNVSTDGTILSGDWADVPRGDSNNSGTLSLIYAVSTNLTGSAALASTLQLSVRAKTTNPCSVRDGAILYSGDLTTAAIGDTAHGVQAGDRVLAAGATESLCFTVALPTSAVPSLVATNAAATFIFSAEQNG